MPRRIRDSHYLAGVLWCRARQVRVPDRPGRRCSDEAADLPGAFLHNVAARELGRTVKDDERRQLPGPTKNGRDAHITAEWRLIGRTNFGGPG